MSTLLVAALAPPLLAACLWDVRLRMIPDWSVLGVAAVGVAGTAHSAALAAADAGLSPAGAALALQAASGPAVAGLACLVIGGLAARFGLWGWGDAKLIAAAGLVAGPGGLLPLLLGTAVAGGSLAALLLLLRGPVRAGHLALPAGAPRWLRVEHTRLRRFPTVPYALAIASGLATALLKG
jgi:prepilin peptidase CpaA